MPVNFISLLISKIAPETTPKMEPFKTFFLYLFNYEIFLGMREKREILESRSKGKTLYFV